MTKWLQRLRGAIGVGLTWAAAWVPVGAVTGLTVALVANLPGVAQVAINYALVFSVLGFVGGTIFASVVSVAESRRRFGQLSLPRFIAWGAVGGLVLGTLSLTASLFGMSFSTFGVTVVGGMSALLGAGSAAGTLAIARSADKRELLERGTDAGLLESFTHETRVTS